MIAQLKLRLLESASARDEALVCDLVALVNEAYNEAEAGIWAVQDTRTSPARMAEAVASGRIIVARGDSGELCGCVQLTQLSREVWEFGMLAVAPKFRKLKAGRALVDFCEGLARDEGATWMQLELLVPVGWKHPNKEWLRKWYTGLGYHQVATRGFDETHAEAMANLKAEVQIEVYRKAIREPG
jgi:GNAT superfamily N-acetyltransferase